MMMCERIKWILIFVAVTPILFVYLLYYNGKQYLSAMWSDIVESKQCMTTRWYREVHGRDLHKEKFLEDEKRRRGRTQKSDQ